jgi:hypothetical protein
MNAGGRTPQELLEELGRDLDAAFDASAGGGWRSWRSWRSWPRRARSILLAAVLVAVGASTATAMRTIFSSAPPVPRLAPLAADLASGTTADGRWQLSAARCSGPGGGVSLLLHVAAGGAGNPCGSLFQFPTTFYEPSEARSLVFGAVPPGVARVELFFAGERRELAPVSADPRALRALHLPAGVLVYAAATGVDQPPSAVAAFDASGRVVFACQEQRCEGP